MGEMAESALEGTCCEWCGVFFTKAHGFPVVCHSCWRASDADERRGHQRATEKER